MTTPISILGSLAQTSGPSGGSGPGGGTLSGSCNPNTVNGQRFNSGTCTTPTTTAQIAGGFPPYSYQWSAPNCTPTSPSTDTTAFQTYIVSGDIINDVGTCLVTDSLGHQISVTVNITFLSLIRNPSGGGPAL